MSYEPRGRVPNRHKVRLARGAESDESSASEADEGHPSMGDRVPKGGRVEGLVELTTRRPEFRPLVNYRSYRLATRSQTVDDHVTSKVNSYLKMMRHHVSEPFTGEPAIRVFDFLSAMRDAFNVNRISEGGSILAAAPLPIRKSEARCDLTMETSPFGNAALSCFCAIFIAVLCYAPGYR
jgi:hypothetical protein